MTSNDQREFMVVADERDCPGRRGPIYHSGQLDRDAGDTCEVERSGSGTDCNSDGVRQHTTVRRGVDRAQSTEHDQLFPCITRSRRPPCCRRRHAACCSRTSLR